MKSSNQHDSKPAPRSRTTRRTAAAGLMMSAICLAPLGAQEEEPAPTVGDAHAAVEQWVETRRVISDERRDWALGKEILAERIDAVQREIESMRGRIAEAKASIDDAETKRAALVLENDTLKTASSALGGTVAELETSAKALLPRLPDPIRARIKPLSQRFPEDPAETKLSLGERYQNVIGVLNEVNKFHRDISVTSEVRTLASGQSAEVTAMYLGLGQAYYASGDGAHAGIGTAAEDAWVWKPANDAAAQISKAIAIHGNSEEPAYVQLPLQVQ